MDLLCLGVIIAISVLLVAMTGLFWKNFRNRFPDSKLFDLIAFVMIVKVNLYFLLPAILRAYSDWDMDRRIGAAPTEIVMVYAIEFIAILAWMTSLALVALIADRAQKKYLVREKTGAASGKRGHFYEGWVFRVSKLFLVLICILYLLNFPYSVEAILKTHSEEGSLLQPIVMLAGPVIGFYLFAYGRKRVGSLAFVVGTVVSGMSIVAAFAFGSRGQVISMAIWMTFLYLFVIRRRYVIYAAAFGVVGIFFFHNAMTVLRADNDFQNRPFNEKVSLLLVGLESGREEKDEFLSSLEFRFGEASRMSVGFLRLVDAGTVAGLNPIKSSLYSPIPRRFLTDKPEQGSIDGTKEGMGMYLIHAVMDGTANMSEFFTGVHAYWELGMPGVFFLSSLTGAFVAICLIAFARLGFAGLPLTMVLLKPPWLEPKLWTSELASDLFHTIVPLLFLWFVIALVFVCLRKGHKVLCIASNSGK